MNYQYFPDFLDEESGGQTLYFLREFPTSGCSGRSDAIDVKLNIRFDKTDYYP